VVDATVTGANGHFTIALRGKILTDPPTLQVGEDAGATFATTATADHLTLPVPAFVLSDGTNSAAIAFVNDATAQALAIKAALGNFPSIGKTNNVSNVNVTGQYVASGNYFQYQIAKANGLVTLPALQVPVNTATEFNGQQLTVTGTSGQYVLTDGTDYAALPFNATALQIKAALESFANIGTGKVIVTGQAGSFNISPSGTNTLPTLEVASDAHPTLSLDVISDMPISVNFQFPTVQGIVDTLNTAMNNALQGVLGGTPVSIQGELDPDSKTLAFDVRLDLAKTASTTVDLGSGFTDLGMSLSGSVPVDLSVGLTLDVTLGLDLTNMATSTLTNPVLPRKSDFFVQFNEVEATGSVSIPDINVAVGAAASNATASLGIQHGQIDLAATVDVGFPDPTTADRISLGDLSSLVS